MGVVVLRNIRKRYGKQCVIDDLNLEVENGEFVTLLGPSGCGKTTILRMIAGLEVIDEGELLIGGKRYNSIPAQKRPIAMVFQSYALFPHMTVRDNILFGLKIQRASAEVMREKLDWVLSMLGLEKLEARYPKQISGGQKQRVALARALVLDPDVLLLDEPLSNLDAALREMAMEELKRIHRQVGKTVIYVTHNQVEAMTMSGRIAVLNTGKLEQYDTPRTVYDMPSTVFAARFIGSPAMNLLNGTISTQDGVVGVDTSAGFLLLDKERSERARTMIGRDVMAGIRPQHVSFVDHLSSRRFSDSHITVDVELIETMGDRSLVVGRTGGNLVVRFLAARDEDFSVDRSYPVFIDGRKVHLFDPETKRNVFS